MQVQSLGGEDLLEQEMATHSSILAGKIPWTEEPSKLQFMGLQKFRHNLATESTCVHARAHTHTHTHTEIEVA